MLAAILSAAALAAAPTVIDLQSAPTTIAVSERVSLTALSTGASRWLVLRVDGRAHHLEIADPAGVTVDMTAANTGAIEVLDAAGRARCAPWEGSPSPLDAAAASPDAYSPLCGGRLWLRKDMKGRRSPLEWSVERVRDNWKRGEQLTELAKRTVFRDRYMEVARTGGDAPMVQGPGAPPALSLKPSDRTRTLAAPNLDIPLLGDHGTMPAGRWAPSTSRGVWVSAVTPGMVAVDPEVSAPGALDPVESKALALLVAFDLTEFNVDFEVGTEHPRVSWSERAPSHLQPAGGGGPDGFDTLAPLTRTGQVAPWEVGLLTATFTGGFKRSHGAFKSGPYAGRNLGSHYGFMQDGVVLSTLQPGLATLVVERDGRVDVRVWAEGDSPQGLRHARQNGVPLVSRGEDGVSRAGAFVHQWGPGNWSGSAEGQLRSLRAAACVVEAPDRRYLIYGWFSTATPRAMAQVLLATGCTNAMLLDMNALEHTYLATYTPGPGGTPVPHHVDSGMAVLDKSGRNGEPLPRFVALPDNRDFFLILRKDPTTREAAP